MVLDTNVLVSGFGWRGGSPAQIIDLWLHGAFQVASSGAQLAELRRILQYPKLQQVFTSPESLIALVAANVVLVDPIRVISISDDPNDNIILELAIAANADVIITGDGDLLRIKTVEGIAIQTAVEFLSLVQH